MVKVSGRHRFTQGIHGSVEIDFQIFIFQVQLSILVTILAPIIKQPDVQRAWNVVCNLFIMNKCFLEWNYLCLFIGKRQLYKCNNKILFWTEWQYLKNICWMWLPCQVFHLSTANDLERLYSIGFDTEGSHNDVWCFKDCVFKDCFCFAEQTFCWV